MSFDYKKILPHLLVVIGFIAVSLIYFKPTLDGKVLSQSDTRQSNAMSHASRDFNKTHKEKTHWMENAFGGMPTYMNAPHYPNLFVKKIEHYLRFLPHPADYLFLYFIGLYILLLVLKVDYRLAAVGALAFGFSTYLIIIIGVGHLTKVLAIAYMPLVLSGILLVFRKRYLWGGLLLAIGAALEIGARHFQITYYLLIIIIILGLVYFYDAIKNKTLPDFFKAIGVMIIAGILALGANITNILATHQYVDWSTRGNTGLTITKDGSPKTHTGMSYDYITQYSYGIGETMDLFIPRFMGGASTEKLGSDSHAYKSLLKVGASPAQADQFLQHAPTYWGDQPIVAAPAYIGAVVIFLFVLALFLIQGRFKWWVLIASALAIILSWGKNFGLLTHFFLDYVPLYSKFRTISMIQVIPELLLPVFGIVGLKKIFSKKEAQEKKLHALKWATIITGGVCIFFLLTKTWFFNFTGLYDAQLTKNIGADFVHALREDRISMLNSDTIRSLIFVLLSAGSIWLFIKGKIGKTLVIGVFALLVLVDLVGVDNNYVNYDSFKMKNTQYASFQPTQADLQIMKDTSHYRVYDLTSNPMNSARASAFHNSIGGYHAAKPGRYQELYDFYISSGNQQVLDMLDAKYFIVSNNGKPQAQRNPGAYGNAWFVDSVAMVPSVNQEMLTLGKINPRTTAVINEKFKDLIPQTTFQPDSTAQIRLTHFQQNEVVYKYHSKEDRLAVFSEIYYPHGWKVHIDGEKAGIAEADYVLRAVYLPKGNHTVTFKFDPQIIHTGSNITVASGILLAIFFAGGLVYTFGFKKKEEKKQSV